MENNDWKEKTQQFQKEIEKEIAELEVTMKQLMDGLNEKYGSQVENLKQQAKATQAKIDEKIAQIQAKMTDSTDEMKKNMQIKLQN